MSVTLKELLYYLFFGLMLAAKGIGLDSGDKLYYILSLTALVCIICKLCMTRYSTKELLAMGLLCLIAFLAYRNSGRLGIVLSVLAVIGMKDMDIRRLFKLGLAVFGITFAATVLLAAGGLIPNPLVVHEKGEIGEVIRWGMGYSTGNVFHISYFILTVLIAYNMRKKYRMKHLLLLMAGNLLVFAFSLSYTGVAVTAFYLFLNLYAVKRTTLGWAEKIICQLPLPLCVLFSIGAPFLSANPIGQKLDSLLQARLSFSYYYLTNQPITLFGARMKDVPNFWIIMDNGYVYFLMTFGIIAFVLFIAGYMGLIARYSGVRGEKARLPELAMIYSFLLYGIMEQFISNAFMNVSLLFMGEQLFLIWKEGKTIGLQSTRVLSKLTVTGGKKLDLGNKVQAVYKKGMERLYLRKSWVCIGGVIGGTLFLTGYIMFGQKPDYVEVPLTSLNYIDAQAVLLHPEDIYDEKDDLKKLMTQCERLIEDEELIENIFLTVKKEYSGEDIINELNGLTPDKIKKMLEFSLPQYVHDSGQYDTFRIRLLKGYHGISDNTYRILLEELVKGLQTEAQYKEMKLQPEAVYAERIGKSFGADRIEHMADKELYFIEKAGSIAAIEVIRTGIMRWVMGAATGACIAGAWVVIASKVRYNRKQ